MSEILPELKIKNEILKQGIVEEAQIIVKLRNHNILEGFISRLSDDTFTLKNSETKEEIIVAYKTVEQIKRVENAQEIKLGVAIIEMTETIKTVIEAVSSDSERNS